MIISVKQIIKMTSPETPPLESIQPEDLHGMATDDVLGRDLVLYRDNEFAAGQLFDHYEELALQKEQAAADATGGETVIISTNPYPHMSSEQRQQLDSFRDTVGANLDHEGEDEIRQGIRKINADEYGESFDQIFDAIAPSVIKGWVNEWAARHEGDVHSGAKWLSWLGHADYDDPEQETRDAQLFNFLQWHNHRIEQMQADPEFSAELERQQEHYQEGISQLENQGFVIAGSAEKVAQKVTDGSLKAYVTDEFESARLEAAAYAQQDKGETYFNPDGATVSDINSLVSAIRYVAAHEFNHAVLGKLPARWLNEAVTELLARTINGDAEFEDLASDPNVIKGTYEDEIVTLYTLIDVANEKGAGIGIRDFTLAYSEAFTGDSTAFDRLNQKLVEAFGFDVLTGMQEKIEEYEAVIIVSEPGITQTRLHEQALRAIRSDLYQQPHVFTPFEDMVA